MKKLWPVVKTWRAVIGDSAYAVVLVAASMNSDVPRWAHALFGVALLVMGASIWLEVDKVLRADLDKARAEHVAWLEAQVLDLARRRGVQ